MKNISNHLKENNLTYTKHFLAAMRISFLLFTGSMASIVHAFLPWTFKNTATNNAIKVAAIRLKRRNNAKLRNKSQK